MADDETQAANDAIREAAAAKAAKTDDKQEPKAPEAKPDADIEEVAAKAENPDAVKTALKAERDAAKQARLESEQLRAQLKEHEDAKKSDQEKLEEGKATAESERDDWRDKYLRLKVGTDKGLPTTLAERLRGDDEKQMAEDADRLLEQFPQGGRKAPAGEADGGKGEADEPDFNSMVRAKVRR